MNNLRTAKAVFLLSIKEALVYRLGMMMTIITFPIAMLISYFVWSTVFAASGSTTIGGFSLEQIVSYYIISIVIFTIIWNPIPTDLHNGVRKGEFIRYIIKPMSYPFYAIINSLGGRFLALFIEFIPVMIIMALILGPSYVMTQNIFLFLVALCIAFIIFHLLSLLMGSLIFWLTNPNGIMWLQRIGSYVLAGGLIPLTFFPETIQRILLFTPFPYFNFVPVTIFVGNTSFAGIEFTYTTLILYAGLQIIVLSLIVFLVWRAAIKNFQGVGA